MELTNVNQSNVAAQRDVIGRDQINNTIHQSSSSPMGGIWKRLRDGTASKEFDGKFIGELSLHIGASLEAEDLVGLAEKLRLGGRDDELLDAKIRKELFAKKIALHQLSEAAQLAFAHILCFVRDRFRTDVRPLIVSKAPQADVDRAIVEKVVDPAVAELGDNDLGIVRDHVWGMIYFVSSKCRIWWDR